MTDNFVQSPSYRAVSKISTLTGPPPSIPPIPTLPTLPHLPTSVTINDFHIVKTLGEGKFGVVQQAFHKQTGAIFAIKKVPK